GVSARMLAGTEGWGDRLPFWSPDSRSIGFFADGKLKRIDIESASVKVLANVGEVYGGGAWSSGGVIVFASTQVGPLFRIPAAGGEPKVATRLQSSHDAHNFPQFLPDGHHFLYSSGGTPDTSGIYVGDLDGPEQTRLVQGSRATYDPSGHLMFLRQSTLVAQDFDAPSLHLSGEPALLAENVPETASFSVATSGTIAFRSGPSAVLPDRRFIWFDRTGRELGSVGADRYATDSMSLSPDGRRLAFASAGPDGSVNIWSLDIERGARSRITLHGSPVVDFSPVW